MAPMKTLSRNENRIVVCNLIDLGFTVPAVSFMMGKSVQTTYSILKRTHRMNGRVITRRPSIFLMDQTKGYLRRIFVDYGVVLHQLVGLTVLKQYYEARGLGAATPSEPAAATKKKIGRAKGYKNKLKVALKVTTKRKPGRPKGSKNKPK